MLQAFRDNLKGTMAIIIVGLMILPFAFFGVDSLFLQDSSAGKAADVNGEAISEMELTRAVRIQKQQLLERLGEQAPADLISEEQLRAPVLTRLINRELLRQAADKGDMAVSDGDLNQLIVSTPQFQQDGEFSPELYTMLLRNMGYTPASYKALLEEDILVNQLAGGLNSSAFATEGDIKTITALTQQTRSFYYLTLPHAGVADQVQVSEAEIQEYYNNNQAQFMRPEQVAVDYIDLNLNDLAAKVDVDPQDIKAQYEANLETFEAATQRHAAHILIEDADADKVAEVQERLNNGEDFAEVAKDASDDLGSSQVGGDLGMTDGTAFPQAFEDALAELEVGQVSAPVETDSGIHFIKLLDIERASPPTLEESTDSIRESLAMARADAEFVELLQDIPDATYNATDLKDAGNSLGVEVHTSGLFDRRGGEGILSNNQVLSAVFSDDVLSEGLASPVIEVSDNHIVVVKLVEHHAAEVKPLQEVAAQVKEIITGDKVAALLEEKAQSLINRLQSGESLQSVAEEQQLEWQVQMDSTRNNEQVDRSLLAEIFQLPKPSSQQPVNTRVTLEGGDVVVAQLTVVKPGTLPQLDESQRTMLKLRLAQDLGAAEMATYQSALNDSADVEIFQ